MPSRARKTKAPPKYKARGAGQFYLYAHNPTSRWANGYIIGKEAGYESAEKAEAALLGELGEDVDPTATVVLLQNVKEFETVKEKKKVEVEVEELVIKPKTAKTLPVKKVAARKTAAKKQTRSRYNTYGAPVAPAM